MDQKKIGLFRNLLVHPGETLKELLEERELTQKELAIRCNVSEKHISTIIHSEKDISVTFAKKLEYVLGISASFWLNLQSNYDKEKNDFMELSEISKEELNILKRLRLILKCYEEHDLLIENESEPERVLDLRRLFQVSNLTIIPKVSYQAAYRAQVSKTSNIDEYVIFAWQTLCELIVAKDTSVMCFSAKSLIELLPSIRKAMFLEQNKLIPELKRLFAKCGVKFEVVRHFKGAPIQGLIKKSKDGNVFLCMTLRKGSADIFWFTLFHEIGHLLHGDFKETFLDFDKVDNQVEEAANVFAADYLIEPYKYKAFIKRGAFDLNCIIAFAKEIGVAPFMVIGRLQKEGYVNWDAFSKQRLYYHWEC